MRSCWFLDVRVGCLKAHPVSSSIAVHVTPSTAEDTGSNKAHMQLSWVCHTCSNNGRRGCCRSSRQRWRWPAMHCAASNSHLVWHAHVAGGPSAFGGHKCMCLSRVSCDRTLSVGCTCSRSFRLHMMCSLGWLFCVWRSVRAWAAGGVSQHEPVQAAVRHVVLAHGVSSIIVCLTHWVPCCSNAT